MFGAQHGRANRASCPSDPILLESLTVLTVAGRHEQR